MKSFIDIRSDSDFSIHNLPYGVFSTEENTKKRIGVAIGDFILDLSAITQFYPIQVQDSLKAEELNQFLSFDKDIWHNVRVITQNLLLEGSKLDKNLDLKNVAFASQSSAKMYVPVNVGDYTDFYSSSYHAMNCGEIIRGNRDLLPNWKYLPVGYHGRSSSIVVSGTPIRRPYGQIVVNGATVFQPCKQQDFELEMACWVGGRLNQLGERIPANKASEYIFGFSLMNDWSARDVQKWEAVPLGPFTAKNLGTTISPWIVTIEALESFAVDNVMQENPEPFEYLKHSQHFNFDINLTASIKPKNDVETIVCKTNYKYLYWTVLQQLAYHTQTGCNMRPGDVLASGTISGPTEQSRASLLELSWNGTIDIPLSNGKVRRFLEDGDEVILRGNCEKHGIRIGFGEATGVLLSAVE